MDGVIVSRFLRHNEKIPVKTHILTIIFPKMRMIPKDSRVGEGQFVGVCFSRSDGALTDTNDAIIFVIDAKSMGVQGGVGIAVVFQDYVDRRSLFNSDDRPRD